MPSPPPRFPHEAPKSGRREKLIRRLADSHRDHPDREVMAGHHNVNHVVPLGFTLALLLGTMPFRARVKCRMPREVVEVVPRIWPSEPELLAVVSRHLREVPRCLRDFGDWSLHSYRAGRALSEAAPGEPVGEALMGELAAFFARTAGVPVEELPPRPDDWPESPRSQEFLHWLVDFAEEKVHRPNRWRFEELFSDVGVHADVMRNFRDDPDRPPLTPRPFCLLHTDVHRANIVVDRRRLAVIDWELASYGDPLHDLATHLVRMDYEKDEQIRMTALWAAAMRRAGHGGMTAGMATDLPAYLDFEYAQSVFPDIMRAALALTTLPWEPAAEDYADAASKVCRALLRAAEPLKLDVVPDRKQAERALRDWCAGPFGRALGQPAARVVPDRGVRNRGVVDAPDGGGDAVADRWAAELTEVGRLLEAPGSGCVLLDFDGPICTLFPAGASERVADDLRKMVSDRGALGLLPPEAEGSGDPRDILRAVHALRGTGQLQDPGLVAGLVADLEALLTAGEATAAHTAPPTPGAHTLIRELRGRRVRMAVVTDNSPRAVHAYLHRHGLADAFGPHVYGRTGGSGGSGLFEPDPDPLNRALDALAAEPGDTLMIGGTVTDVAAAEKAEVPFLGYAPDGRAADLLHEAGAKLVLPSLRPLLDLLGSPHEAPS
ncbi:phosphotransferase [Streptomyces sp. DSM 118878]